MLACVEGIVKATGVAAAVALAVGGLALASGNSHGEPPSMPRASVSTDRRPPPAATTITQGGTYEVGVDIARGRWHTDGPRRRTLL